MKGDNNMDMSKSETIKNCLASREIKVRKCVYISREVQEKVARVVNTLSNGEATIGSYIDNVILEHLNKHKEELNALYYERMEDLI